MYIFTLRETKKTFFLFSFCIRCKVEAWGNVKSTTDLYLRREDIGRTLSFGLFSFSVTPWVKY